MWKTMRIANVILWAGSFGFWVWACLILAHFALRVEDISAPFVVNAMNEAWWPGQAIAVGIGIPGLALVSAFGLWRAVRS